MAFRSFAVILMPLVLLACSGCCEPDCEGKCCGDDGCGGTCKNECPMGEWCHGVTCTCSNGDYPNCNGKCCGPDGVGGTCPDNCPTGSECNIGTCVCDPDLTCTLDEDCYINQCCQDSICTDMDCGVFECGPDPVCGNECGPCTDGYDCIEGYCVEDPCDYCVYYDDDCGFGYTCEKGLCLPAVALPGSCIETDDCPPGYYCENYQCYRCPDESQREDCEWRGKYGILGYPCPTEEGMNIQGKDCDPCLTCLSGYEIGDCVDVGDCLVPAGYNPGCHLGKCGYSFCSRSCEEVDCPPGFVPDTSLGGCHCFPES